MKKLLAAIALIGLGASTGGAEEPKQSSGKNDASPKKPLVPTLRVGDPAPDLNVSKWLQGPEVKRFEPGHVYVVEFWAVWCGPCIAFMPDLAALQAEYKERGLTCIGATICDPDNTEETAAAFVKKRGPKLKYTFCYIDDTTRRDAWMTAAGKEAIPCSFVVDKAGRIGYVGNPMYLSVIAPMVVSGTMSAQAIGERMKKVTDEWAEVSETLTAGFKTGNHRPGLKALNQFEANYPSMTNNLIFVRAKLSLLPMVGEYDEAKTVAETVIAKAIKQENPSSLSQVAGLLRNGSGKNNKELLAVAVQAAEAAVRMVGDQDARALIDLAETYLAARDKAKAKQFAALAVAAAGVESAAVKESIEQRARDLER